MYLAILNSSWIKFIPSYTVHIQVNHGPWKRCPVYGWKGRTLHFNVVSASVNRRYVVLGSASQPASHSVTHSVSQVVLMSVNVTGGSGVHASDNRECSVSSGDNIFPTPCVEGVALNNAERGHANTHSGYNQTLISEAKIMIIQNLKNTLKDL